MKVIFCYIFVYFFQDKDMTSNGSTQGDSGVEAVTTPSSQVGMDSSKCLVLRRLTPAPHFLNFLVTSASSVDNSPAFPHQSQNSSKLKTDLLYKTD